MTRLPLHIVAIALKLSVSFIVGTVAIRRIVFECITHFLSGIKVVLACITAI